MANLVETTSKAIVVHVLQDCRHSFVNRDLQQINQYQVKWVILIEYPLNKMKALLPSIFSPKNSPLLKNPAFLKPALS